jgi:prepilin-type processing-associated H-X9-DG protein
MIPTECRLTDNYGVATKRITGPSQYMFLGDSVFGLGGSKTYKYGRQCYNIYYNNNSSKLGVQQRHNNRMNLWFFDGHASAHSPKEFDQIIDSMFGSNKASYYVDANLNYKPVD